VDATAIVVAYVLVSIGVIIAFLLALRGRMVHRSAAPAPPRTARGRATYRQDLTVLRSGAACGAVLPWPNGTQNPTMGPLASCRANNAIAPGHPARKNIQSLSKRTGLGA